FAGGFSLDAVGEIVARADDAPDQAAVLDGVDELVAKSLVSFDDETARYRLLEPIRQYLAERLEDSGRAAAVRRAHAEWVATLAERAERSFHADQAAWSRRLRAEQHNIRAALVHDLERGDGITALRIGAALGDAWFSMGQPGARDLLDRALLVAP